ncbi:CpsD/CapB family tyrosine-protein kinase [Paenibacillus sp. JSM ZJ436]|uniref:CpsD/CapB family tyrosine-protein kinase n=1 Tax=Paenibacillus sp. JSM ZJ436 TaxID=3376190 RepID=UPI003796476C
MATTAVEQGLITSVNPNSSLSEAYKMLRTNIRYSSAEKAYKVLLITSAVSGEGKTTTAANLAVTYAQEGHKVLLLEGDLRQPSLQQFFRKPLGRQGLTDLLTGHHPLSECISESEIPDLDVLPSGTATPKPSELLGSERLKRILSELSQTYDLIIMDSPPSIAYADAQILATLSDGVVLVIGDGMASKAQVKRVKHSMEHVHAEIIGAVFNQT